MLFRARDIYDSNAQYYRDVNGGTPGKYVRSVTRDSNTRYGCHANEVTPSLSRRRFYASLKK